MTLGTNDLLNEAIFWYDMLYGQRIRAILCAFKSPLQGSSVGAILKTIDVRFYQLKNTASKDFFWTEKYDWVGHPWFYLCVAHF